MGQQLKSSAADDDEEPVVPPHVGDFCQDGKTLKVVSLSAGCRQPTLDDMHIRSTCKEDQTKGKKQDLAIAVSWHLLAFLAYSLFLNIELLLCSTPINEKNFFSLGISVTR